MKRSRRQKFSLKGVRVLLFSWVVRGFSFITPRDPYTWVFIGWHEGKEGGLMADNSKYLYLHVSQEVVRVRAVWIARDQSICDRLMNRGYKAYSANTLRGAYYSLRAGITITDGILQREHWKFSGRSKIIQLWHGKGPKKTGRKSEYGRRPNRFLMPNLSLRYEFLIAASELAGKLLADSFGYGMEKVYITGLPKYDVYFRKIPDSDIDADHALGSILNECKRQEKRVILYAPTFRPDGSNPLAHLDLKILDDYLLQDDSYLIASLHPKFATKDWIPKDTFKRIRFIEAGYDIYPLLSKFDGLITDYSSLSVDFLVFEKPIYYFVYDLETYKKEMGLYDELWNVLPGPKISLFKDLISALEVKVADRTAATKAKSELYKFTDGRSSERVTNAIFELIK